MSYEALAPASTGCVSMRCNPEFPAWFRCYKGEWCLQMEMLFRLYPRLICSEQKYFLVLGCFPTDIHSTIFFIQGRLGCQDNLSNFPNFSGSRFHYAIATINPYYCEQCHLLVEQEWSSSDQDKSSSLHIGQCHSFGRSQRPAQRSRGRLYLQRQAWSMCVCVV